MVAPVVALSTYREQTAFGVWHERADVLHAAYSDAVYAVGGLPVLLPPAAATEGSEHVVARASEVLARVDALVLTGGADVDPGRYGEVAHPETRSWREDRDAWEVALLSAADALALPVLGVCRGMQVMAVAAGGTLEQHVPDRVGGSAHSPGADAFGPVEVVTVPGTRVAGLLGRSAAVRCHHHQGVAVHPGFVVSAVAPDATVEAIERPGDRFCVGVQWHPETAADVGLLAGLVRAAAAYRPR